MVTRLCVSNSENCGTSLKKLSLKDSGINLGGEITYFGVKTGKGLVHVCFHSRIVITGTKHQLNAKRGGATGPTGKSFREFWQVAQK